MWSYHTSTFPCPCGVRGLLLYLLEPSALLAGASCARCAILSLKKEKILRLFKLNTGQDDHAIMFFEDYINQMDIAVKKLGARSQHDIEVFEWFKIHVIEYKLDVSIDHQELLFLLSAGGEVKDEDITLLINVGLLTRQMIDPNMYWFAIPYIGSVLKGPEGTPFFLEPKKVQRDAVSSVGEKTLAIITARHEVSSS